MTKRIEAVFEKGVFRPVAPIALTEGARVEVVYEAPHVPRPPQQLVQALLDIAGLPQASPDDGFSAADHDNILYGKEGTW